MSSFTLYTNLDPQCYHQATADRYDRAGQFSGLSEERDRDERKI